MAEMRPFGFLMVLAYGTPHGTCLWHSFHLRISLSATHPEHEHDHFAELALVSPKLNRHQRSRQDQVPEPFDHDNRIHAAVSCGFAASTVDAFRVKWLSPPESAMCIHQTNHPATSWLNLASRLGACVS
uniref:(northern house mosquito) hypothetical protein n=1 Tax=Culex pipiens TaxID=7175 RepID=A0A8D8ANX4_CULPI